MNVAPFSHIVVLMAFCVNMILPPTLGYSQDIDLPAPGHMVYLSPAVAPPMLTGLTVDPNEPFHFDFIMDTGDSGGGSKPTTHDPQLILKQEANKVIRYFLAALTTHEEDMWVNLSPYEKDRIIPESFGLTQMGQDLLAQDYILKQVTASLIYPEKEVGRAFWKRVYEQAGKKFNSTEIPVNTFNKVWIVPDHARVYEHNNTAIVLDAHLKVMLEEDYLAISKFTSPTNQTVEAVSTPGESPSEITSKIIREIVIPSLEKEVNQGANFAPLRQVYHSLILANWFKSRMRDSLLGHAYVNRNKINGIDKPSASDKIYQRYLQALKKGVYNYIKVEQDPATKSMVPRKYFSGGLKLDQAMNTTQIEQQLNPLTKLDTRRWVGVRAGFAKVPSTLDNAMEAEQFEVHFNEENPYQDFLMQLSSKFSLRSMEQGTQIWLQVQLLHEIEGENYVQWFSHNSLRKIETTDFQDLSFKIKSLSEQGREILIKAGALHDYGYYLPKGQINHEEKSIEFVRNYVFKSEVSKASLINHAVLAVIKGHADLDADRKTRLFLDRSIIRKWLDQEVATLTLPIAERGRLIEELKVIFLAIIVVDRLASMKSQVTHEEYRGFIDDINKAFDVDSTRLGRVWEKAKRAMSRKEKDNASVALLEPKQSPGGIDLSANRMKVDVDSSSDRLQPPMKFDGLTDVQLNGIYIKDIDIKQLTDLPRRLGFVPS